MKFAFVNGERQEAQKGLYGICVGCGKMMIPKCGLIKIKHWAHKSNCECDHWWENETEWHRSWKNNFPVECQEVRHRAEDGEWHIADVKTKKGFILEFQHSFLKNDERQARNNFYGNNLVWVVDGLKRKKDQAQFDLFLKSATLINQSVQLIRLPSFIEECSLLCEWSECDGHVFFDFGSEIPLWCLLPKSAQSKRYLIPYSRQNFITLHNDLLNGLNFSDFAKFLNDLVFAHENPRPQQVLYFAPERRTLQRQISIPQNPSRRYLHYLNRSPRRRGRL